MPLMRRTSKVTSYWCLFTCYQILDLVKSVTGGVDQRLYGAKFSLNLTGYIIIVHELSTRVWRNVVSLTSVHTPPVV